MASEQNGDRRVGQRLTQVVQVRFSPTQHAYLQELAEANGTPVSEEVRRAVDEALVASIETRKRRDREVRKLLDAIERGEVDPEDHLEQLRDAGFKRT